MKRAFRVMAFPTCEAGTVNEYVPVVVVVVPTPLTSLIVTEAPTSGAPASLVTFPVTTA